MKFSENRETFSKVAILYYLAEMSQEEIAEIFGVSRFKISRVLKKCRAMKIVEFKVNSSAECLRNLERELSERLNVSRVMIAPSGSTLYESKENVARFAAKYLETHIKDGMKIGLSWGSTIQQTARFYSKKDRFPKTVFVQLSGSHCSRQIIGDGYIDGSIFVQEFALKASSEWSIFPVPYVVKNPELKKMLYEEEQIKKHVALFKEIDLALIALGSDDPAKSVSYLSGYLTYEETKELSDNGMGADICGTRLSIDGKIRETILTNRVLTIDIEDLHKLQDVCAIGAGSEKALSFIAGCRGGFIKCAIMDEVCALSILNQLKSGL